MSVVIGIDVGAYKHTAAVCQPGNREAEKKVLRYAASRAGFDELDAWLSGLGEVEHVVVESSGHYSGGRWRVTYGSEACRWRWSILWRPNISPRADCSGASQTPPTRAHWWHWEWSSSRREGSRSWVLRSRRQRALPCA